jgi:hydrogenase maturation protease
MTAVIVGVGNSFRGDDGAGLAVADLLRGLMPEGVSVVACEREPSRLIDTLEGASVAVVVDAVASGAEPGTLYRFDASSHPLPERVFRSSTHAFGVGEAVELARALGRLPATVIVHGIEGASFAAGEVLSAPVKVAVETAAHAVLEDLAHLPEGEPCTSAR